MEVILRIKSSCKHANIYVFNYEFFNQLCNLLFMNAHMEKLCSSFTYLNINAIIGWKHGQLNVKNNAWNYNQIFTHEWKKMKLIFF
jgi:hypothetical protein